jgi:hypothetical protein
VHKRCRLSDMSLSGTLRVYHISTFDVVELEFRHHIHCNTDSLFEHSKRHKALQKHLAVVCTNSFNLPTGNIYL